MKFYIARTALALAATLTLASCGGGGDTTYPINVNVKGVLYPGLVLSTNGQDYAVNPTTPAGGDVDFVFPKGLDYGETYNVLPKGYAATDSAVTNAGAQPKHQNCGPVTGYPNGFPVTGTAGQLAKIQINYTCSVNSYPLGGTVKGLTTTGLVVANGSSSSPVTVVPATDATTQKPTGADVPFALNGVPYASTYGATILSQPAGQTCTLAGGANGSGAGVMDDAAEAAGGVTNLVITCK